MFGEIVQSVGHDGDVDVYFPTSGMENGKRWGGAENKIKTMHNSNVCWIAQHQGKKGTDVKICVNIKTRDRDVRLKQNQK